MIKPGSIAAGLYFKLMAKTVDSMADSCIKEWEFSYIQDP